MTKLQLILNCIVPYGVLVLWHKGCHMVKQTQFQVV